HRNGRLGEGSRDVHPSASDPYRNDQRSRRDVAWTVVAHFHAEEESVVRAPPTTTACDSALLGHAVSAKPQAVMIRVAARGVRNADSVSALSAHSRCAGPFARQENSLRGVPRRCRSEARRDRGSPGRSRAEKESPCVGGWWF